MENVGLKMNPLFWAGKRVFLTGHTGFKGSWLTLWLSKMDAVVKGYSLAPPTSTSLFVEAGVADDVNSQIADIRDLDVLFASMSEFEPEVVIHMAAQPLVRLSYSAPVDTYSTNVMGTVHLLDCCRRIESIRSIVVVTSDKCYQNNEWLWGYRENEPMGGFDPYSNSKGCTELVVSSFRDSYFSPDNYSEHCVALGSARAGNVIGGGDWAEDRLVPDILTAFQSGERVIIRNPHAIRPWQHVLEPLSGYLLLAERLYDSASFSGAWNFGPNESDAKPVEYIVDVLSQLWGDGSSWAVCDGDHPHEAHYLKLDCSKAKSLLNWHPKWELENALAKIVSWHKAWLGNEDMKTHCLKEIEVFMESY
jgi:CDP-glucose 4,6-dehydratase